MRKWFVVAAALVAIGVPAALAASSDKEKPVTAAQSQSANNAAKACKAEHQSMGTETFATKYGTNHNLRNAFGKCVSGKSKDDKDEKDDDTDEKSGGATKACKAERASMGAEAFAKKYGTNAFGKCVSSKAKAKARRPSSSNGLIRGS